MRTEIVWNHKWAFTKDTDAVPEKMPQRWDYVNIPHTWNAIDGQDGGNDYYCGKGYYAKELKKSDLPEAEQYFLQFDGVNSSAAVYVNGVQAASHDGGYSTWRADITELLQEENLITVVADNAPNDRVYPQNADFTFYGGMYRDVKILAVSKTHFDLEYYGSSGLAVTPVIEDKDKAPSGTVPVRVQTWITEPRGTLRIVIKDACGSTVACTEVPAADTNTELLELPDVHIWNGTKDPYLYRAEASIIADGEGDIIDCVSTRFGVRSYRIDPDEGFILNGEKYPLRGVARHQDRWEKGNALSPEDHRQDIEIIREMGANTIRLAHYQHSQVFYDLCDEFGMVVWAEIPYISMHMPNGRENTISQMTELIVQNYNHPCIAVWGLANETTLSGITDDVMDNHRALNDLVHKMDKTRPTVIAFIGSCDKSEEIVYLPDVISYNYYYGWYEGNMEDNGPILDAVHAAHPKQPLGISEYGSEALDWHTNNPRKGDYTEEYQALYHESMIRQIKARPYLWATHVWNMFDFGADRREEGGGKGQNRKGLVTIDRKYKKDAFYAYKAWLSDDPFVHIAGKRYADRTEEETEIKVYSNQPCVELFVNGKSVGVNDTEKEVFHFHIPNEGVQEITARAGRGGELEDRCTIRKVDEPNEAYIMKDPGIVLNWFDIAETEGYYSLNSVMKDVYASPAAEKAVKEVLGAGLPDKEAIEKGAGGIVAKLIDTMTILRLANALYSGGFGMDKIPLSKEQLLELNEVLNKIPVG